MKQLAKLALINALCLATLPVMAADPLIDNSAQENNANTQSLVTYLKNLGAYLGYDLGTGPSNPPSATSTQLLDPTAAALAQTYLYTTFFGALPVPMASKDASFQFIPDSASGAKSINDTANLTFSQQQYSSPDSKAQVTVNSLTDQQPYQNDPVSQSIYNILGTPDVSYCTSDGVVSNPSDPNPSRDPKSSTTCKISPQMFQNQIIQNVVGPLPSTSEFFSYQTNSLLIPQLNSDALIAPLFYTTTDSDSKTATGSPTPSTQNAKGLSAQNQAQQAANFIRYVSGSVVPVTLPSRNQYDTLYTAALNSNDATAEAKLSTYLTNLRVYAAQTSVGMSNLYYILSKRLPQAPQNGGGKDAGSNAPTSEALNEYNMATWRIFKQPDTTGSNQQWIDKINTASPATVQKEIAVLLSEINYQLYLTRQINERMLFTSSVSLLQGTKANQPSADLSNQETGAATTTQTNQ